MRRVVLLGLILALPVVSVAQTPATGIPPFGSIDRSPFDAVNRQDLNANLQIPIVSSAGRGRTFSFAIVYDSLVWRKSGSAWAPVTDSSGTAIWGWKKNFPSGFTSYTSVSAVCDTVPVTHYPHYFNYVYTDTTGTKHPFAVNFYMPNNCDLNPQGPRTGYATDDSGFYLDATSPQSPTVTAPSGTVVTGASLTDANGNFVSAVIVSSSETDWKDTAGHTALKIITGASSIQYQVPATDGTFQTYLLKLQNYNVKTNFACSGVVEYTGTVSLPYELDLPNNTKYLFNYEPTPNFSGYVTARVSQVTLPTGGTYQYQYPATPNNGISCTDAGVNSFTRIINDGTASAQWAYLRIANGSGWTTTVTAPLQPGETVQDQAVYTFDSNGRETLRQFYQGSVSPANLLRAVSTSWAANGTPSSSSITLEDGATRSQIETTYDSNGNLVTTKEHDWGSPSVGPIVRTTTYTYLTGTAYTAKNIVDRVTQVKVTDTNGVVKSRGSCPAFS